MFRDRQEELDRLQEQLLEEEEPEEVLESEDEDGYLDEEELNMLLDGNDQGENPRVYQNYSNDYGRNLRNYATGYKAYNADKTDEDMDSYSQAVLEPKKDRGITALLLLMLGLLCGIAAVLGWIFLRVKGLI